MYYLLVVLYFKLFKARSQKIKLHWSAKLSKHTYLEGYNKIGVNVNLGGSIVGRGTYICNDSSLTSTKIGRFCSIGENVRTSLGLHPSQTFVSTHPAFFSTKKQAGFSFVKQNLFKEHHFVDQNQKYVVSIGNDVWIGNNVTIMDGIVVSDGAIIGAGSIVTKNVPAYGIVAGTPAKLIKYRFTEKQINFLLNYKWWNKENDELQHLIQLMSNIDFLISK